MSNRSTEASAVIGQSGGPTVVINQSLVGCVEALRGGGFEGRILGARHAVQGMVKADFVDLGAMTSERLERIAETPSSALGSSRDKPDPEYCRKIFEVFARENVEYFFYVGGNDSSDTCRIIAEMAKTNGVTLEAFHVPKTIDNDLIHNDHCPGYGSAARFVACALSGDDLDNRALPGIKIDVIMGRHAGFLTAASILARRREGDGPHLVYVPEVAFDVDRFVGEVERVYAKLGRCLIAASEGVHDAAGTPIAAKLAASLDKDAHGNIQLSGTGALGDFLAQLLKDRLGKKLRVRADTLGYLQRSFLGCTSEVDRVEARAVGREAARLALAGAAGGSVTITRAGNRPYRVAYGLQPLAAVAAKTRTMPAEYMAGTCDVAEEFRGYVEPLVGPLPAVEVV